MFNQKGGMFNLVLCTGDQVESGISMTSWVVILLCVKLLKWG